MPVGLWHRAYGGDSPRLEGWAGQGPGASGPCWEMSSAGGHDPPYTLKRSLWPQGGKEAGGGRQEGDHLFGGCCRIQVRQDSGLDKGHGHRKRKQESI